MIDKKESATLPEWLPMELFPFENRFAEIDGHTIHYIDEGSGPTLLLLHGNPTWSFLYRDIVLELRDRFRCIALDYPGFGLSTPTDGYDFLPASHARVVESFVKEMKLADISIMVQDWAGPIGLWVAGRRPEDIKALIIGNTWAWPIDGDPHFERFSKIMGGPIGGFFIRHFNAFVNFLIPSGVKRKKLPKEVMNAYRSPFPTKESRLPTRIFPREIAGSPDFLTEVEAGLVNLKDTPTLILWGDKDFAFREQEKTRFESAFPKHHTVILEGAGHYIQEDAPDEISRSIMEWWDRGI